MTTDPLTAARALIEPLTGYTSAPWAQVSAGDNGYHIGSGGWTVDASDPDGGYFGDWHICLTTGCYLTAEADARLIAAAPDLRDMVPTLADALEAERAKVAAAYEAAAALPTTPDWRWRFEPSWSAEELSEAIRALTPADAQAALDKLLAKARLEGWRAGRDAAANEAALYGCSEGADEYTEGIHVGYTDAVGQIVDGILALPEPKEASRAPH